MKFFKLGIDLSGPVPYNRMKIRTGFPVHGHPELLRSGFLDPRHNLFSLHFIKEDGHALGSEFLVELRVEVCPG